MNLLLLRIAAGLVFILPNFGAINSALGPLSEVGSLVAVAVVLATLGLDFVRAAKTEIPISVRSFYLLIFAPSSVAALAVLASDEQSTIHVLTEVAIPLAVAAAVVSSTGLARPQDVMSALPVSEVLLLMFFSWAIGLRVDSRRSSFSLPARRTSLAAQPLRG